MRGRVVRRGRARRGIEPRRALACGASIFGKMMGMGAQWGWCARIVEVAGRVVRPGRGLRGLQHYWGEAVDTQEGQRFGEFAVHCAVGAARADRIEEGKSVKVRSGQGVRTEGGGGCRAGSGPWLRG